MADLNNLRRYYLHKRVIARRRGEALETSWQASQEAEPGTALPGAFPHLTALQSVGYTKSEDLDGADSAELVDFVGLSTREADAVIAAFEAL